MVLKLARVPVIGNGKAKTKANTNAKGRGRGRGKAKAVATIVTVAAQKAKPDFYTADKNNIETKIATIQR